MRFTLNPGFSLAWGPIVSLTVSPRRLPTGGNGRWRQLPWVPRIKAKRCSDRPPPSCTLSRPATVVSHRHLAVAASKPPHHTIFHFWPSRHLPAPAIHLAG
jgi:hypothetical protein